MLPLSGSCVSQAPSTIAVFLKCPLRTLSIRLPIHQATPLGDRRMNRRRMGGFSGTPFWLDSLQREPGGAKHFVELSWAREHDSSRLPTEC